MTIAVTGHRPNKLGGYSQTIANNLLELAVRNMAQCRGVRVITGMAIGWDQAVAEACCALGVEWTAALPFNGQESKWPDEPKARYRRLLEKARQIYVVSPGGYEVYKMMKRNHWMVDQCNIPGDLVLALYDGVAGGGTSECVNYAEMCNVPVLNVWPEWQVLNR